MDSKSLHEMQVEIRGEFGGVGIEVTMEEGSIKVVAPIDETPAAKAGIMANDIITHLDEEPVQGLTLDQVVERMRGPVNTKIELKIMRKGQDKPVGVAIIRDIIRVRSVRSRLEGDDVGLIRVTQFNEQAGIAQGYDRRRTRRAIEHRQFADNRTGPEHRENPLVPLRVGDARLEQALVHAVASVTFLPSRKQNLIG
jgi:C-terminal processing protease CtpA/Prc